jgi:hypothetical protein
VSGDELPGRVGTQDGDIPYFIVREIAEVLARASPSVLRLQ